MVALHLESWQISHDTNCIISNESNLLKNMLLKKKGFLIGNLTLNLNPRIGLPILVHPIQQA